MWLAVLVSLVVTADPPADPSWRLRIDYAAGDLREGPPWHTLEGPIPLEVSGELPGGAVLYYWRPRWVSAGGCEGPAGELGGP